MHVLDRTGRNWHTLLIEEVNMQPVASAVVLLELVRRRAAEISSAVDVNVYLSFILLKK